MSDTMYGHDGQEVLTATCIEDFMEETIDNNCMVVGEGTKAILDRMEEDLNFPVTAIEYERMELPPITTLAKSILEDVVENLDENYRIGADDGYDITSAMRKASMEFAMVIHKEYTPWNCEPCGKVVLTRADFEEATNESE